MVDHLSRMARSRVMAAIRSKNTRPEIMLRKALRNAGYVGYRIHAAKLPGRPDIAFTRWKVAVFVDGVFWHGHPEHWHPERASDYWIAKIAKNQERDTVADAALTELGWTVVRIWDKDVLEDQEACVCRVARSLRSQGWQPATRDA